MRRVERRLGGERLLGGELAARPAQRGLDRPSGVAQLVGELLVGLTVERPGDQRALLGAQRRQRGEHASELLAYEQRGHRVGKTAVGLGLPVVPDRVSAFTRGDRRGGGVGSQCVAEKLMLARADPVKCIGRLARDAPGGERGKRPAAGLPGTNCRDQPKPGLLGDVAAVTATRQPQPADGAADQRLVAAQQLFLSATVIALRRGKQRAFVKRGGVASAMRGSHARAGSARQ